MCAHVNKLYLPVAPGGHLKLPQKKGTKGAKAFGDTVKRPNSTQIF